MRLAFHQPNYLPNLGFFYKMASVDLFVVTTQLQFVRREWQSRAKLRGTDGRDLMLSVPVLGSNRQLIAEALVNNGEPWQRKHAGTIRGLYGRTSEPEILSRILAIYAQPHQRLVDLNMAIIMLIRDALGVRTRIVLEEEVAGQRHDLLIALCRKYGADTYLSGLGGKLYMDEEYFGEAERAGIAIEFVGRNVTGEHPYSSIHYLLAEGAAAAQAIVRGNGRPAARAETGLGPGLVG